MFLQPFFTQQDQQVSISAEQGSRFAKEVAEDFNPLHNIDSKRFVVPGDLLFSMVLERFGIGQKMAFQYQGMVGADTSIEFLQDAATFRVQDEKGKTYLSGQTQGDSCQNPEVIEGFCHAYVAFSGLSFPHILVPLMEQKDAMINPARPMVIYESMAFEFDQAVTQLAVVPELALSEAQFDVDGKRGKVHIHFDIKAESAVIGRGHKSMTLSGLKPYDNQQMADLVASYQEAKAHYLEQLQSS